MRTLDAAVNPHLGVTGPAPHLGVTGLAPHLGVTGLAAVAGGLCIVFS